MLITFLVSFLGSLLAISSIILVGFAATGMGDLETRSKTLEVTSGDLQDADADIRIRLTRLEAAVAAPQE